MVSAEETAKDNSVVQMNNSLDVSYEREYVVREQFPTTRQRLVQNRQDVNATVDNANVQRGNSDI